MASNSGNTAYDQATCDIREYSRLIGHDAYKSWHEWAHGALRAMMDDPDVTFQALADAETRIRLTAASLVDLYWPPNALFAERCLHLAFEDSEPAIRGAAIRSVYYKLHRFLRAPTEEWMKLRASLFAGEQSGIASNYHDMLFEAKAAVAKAESTVVDLCRFLADDQFASISKSTELAEQHATSSNPRIRRAALLSMSLHPRSDNFFRICSDLLLNDRDLDVRVQALDVLSAAYARTNDREIGKLMAGIVQDAAQPAELRRRLYVSLYLVRGMPVDRLLKAADDTCFPDEVDWDFVRTFL